MAKKRDDRKPDLESGRLKANPFAGLGALRESLPGAELPPATAATDKGRTILPPTPDANARIVVRFEVKGRGGKAITRVEGLALVESELDGLARTLRKALGAGVRVEQGDLMVQGKQVERVALWLEDHEFGPVVRGN